MHNNDSPWMTLFLGVMLVIGDGLLLPNSDGKVAYRGIPLPTWGPAVLVLVGLVFCVMSIYAIISRRRAKPRLDDEQKDIPQEVLDFLNKKDADAKQNEAGPYQAKLEHTHPAGQTSSPRGEDKEKPADKGEGKNA